jgi:HEPN domain-containing protein
MSREKYRAHAGRWLAQARADLRAAESSLSADSHEWACFQAQQAAEKALKALWLWHSCDPWGHSVLKLIDEFPLEAIRQVALAGLRPAAKALDKLYVPTRYPNGLPELAPFEVYTAEEARTAIESAGGVVRACESQLSSA